MQENQLNPNLQRDMAAGSTPAPLQGTPWGRLALQDVPRSLTEVAQRDLDAALQLLADRAQYITGATGAAIALRREGRNDMLCRASTGSSAPELGALLSAEYGLSGESVRTRQLMRCDDAERDARVNREVCRRLGIASVVVMPVVNDDGVLGVFELFSGRAHAFGDRDLSAVQRLSQMVETAVRLARVTENFPEQLKAAANPANAPAEEKILDDGVDELRGNADRAGSDEQIIDVDFADSTPAVPVVAVPASAKPAESVATPVRVAAVPETASPAPAAAPAVTAPHPVQPLQKSASEVSSGLTGPAAVVSPNRGESGPVQKATTTVPSSSPVAETSAPAKPLFWSALQQAAEGKGPEKDQSHVPPVLRGLRKCEACGFPISEGRVLCVECEEKKWRGQLKRPQPMPTGAISAARKPEGQAFAAAQSAGAGVSAAPNSRTLPTSRKNGETWGTPNVAVPASRAQAVAEMKPVGPGPGPAPAVKSAPVQAAQEFLASPASSAPVFSAGLESSQSWFSRYRYILLVLLIVAAVVAGMLFSR